ncbi:hypothetical protein [Segatella salivae]|uniref:hypothetical protein n=1 Tax=Segatella salivae TaxID=228604 RepID=UPI0028E4447E|nr:hypothetical protein [Segatella salivae]
MHAEILQKGSACVPPPFGKDEIKKAQHRWRCTPRNILTQGSSLCSPTLGYQKRNPYGVLLSHEKLSFCAILPFEKMKLKKRNTDGVEKGISNDDISFSL